MQQPFILELLKITRKKDGKVTYQAVNEKTADNILNTSSAYTHLDNPDIQFDATLLGDVEVYVPEWIKKAIREGS